MHKAIRYIGSKQKLLSFLEDNLFLILKEGDSIYEGFVGSGIVSQYLGESKKELLISGGDISLYSKSLFNILNIGVAFKEEYILSLVKEFEEIPLIEGNIFNEFSHGGKPLHYGESRNFFHAQSGKTIDTFKQFINDKLSCGEITKSQAEILLFFLLSYACKVANTTSVFGAYLKSPAKYKLFTLDFVKKVLLDLALISERKNFSHFYLGDVVENLRNIPPQKMIYLDPPYSTRKYESNYHILNYIADLNFSPSILKENSKTGMSQEVFSNPFGKKKETKIIFENMIVESMKKCEILGISYNTDGLIKQSWIEPFCKNKGYHLETKMLQYKRFKSHLDVANTEGLEEIIWLIRK